MKNRRIYLLFWCLSVGLLAFVALDYWSERNAPAHKRFARLWQEDVAKLEASPKLPRPWFDVREVEVYGGTPETKNWLRRFDPPLKANKIDGNHRLEVMIAYWEESGQKGVLVQYNLVDLKSKNMIWELSRMIMLEEPRQVR